MLVSVKFNVDVDMTSIDGLSDFDHAVRSAIYEKLPGLSLDLGDSTEDDKIFTWANYWGYPNSDNPEEEALWRSMQEDKLKLKAND